MQRIYSIREMMTGPQQSKHPSLHWNAGSPPNSASIFANFAVLFIWLALIKSDNTIAQQLTPGNTRKKQGRPKSPLMLLLVKLLAI